MDKKFSVIGNRVNVILERNMSEDGYKLWLELYRKIPPVWNRLASSTKKYHRRENGDVPSILEHTYEMLNSFTQIMSCMRIQPKSKDCDVVCLAIMLHDSLKYGINSPHYAAHTDKKHDRIIGNTIQLNKDKLRPVLNEQYLNTLEKITRYHSGIWSTDATADFSFKDYPQEVFLVHLLDMLSTRDCLKYPELPDDAKTKITNFLD